MSLSILCKFGNEKAGEDTLLFNMGSATLCPSRGRCPVLHNERSCYPERVETLHPEIKTFRDRQGDYWRSTPGEKISADILGKIGRRTVPIKYLRFNEAGDFWSQDCVDKLSLVAAELKQATGVATYGFTARDDLDFSNVHFLVKGSGHARGNNGRCIVIDPEGGVPEGYILCPENCRACDLCMHKNHVDIAFVER